MQIHFIRQENHKSLVFFSLGWGCDHSVLTNLIDHIPPNHDIICTYNYQDANFEQDQIAEILQQYDSVSLCAWSFGVWVAEQIFTPNFTFIKALALCASPHPASTSYGIDPKRLNITIKGFKTKGTKAFDQAVYGKYLDQIDNLNSSRTLESKIEELENLERLSSQAYTPHIQWDKALIASSDLIFPLKNLQAYWGIQSIVVPLPHYPFGDYKLILAELGL